MSRKIRPDFRFSTEKSLIFVFYRNMTLLVTDLKIKNTCIRSGIISIPSESLYVGPGSSNSCLSKKKKFHKIGLWFFVIYSHNLLVTDVKIVT